MKLKPIVVFATVLICCSPTSNIQDNLIGNWINSIIIYATGFDPNDPNNQVIVTDTIYHMKQVQINSNEIIFTSSIQYKTDSALSTDTQLTFTYSIVNDTLITLMKDNKKEYYKFGIIDSKLVFLFLHGDVIPIDSFTTNLTGIYKRQ